MSRLFVNICEGTTINLLKLINTNFIWAFSLNEKIALKTCGFPHTPSSCPSQNWEMKKLFYEHFSFCINTSIPCICCSLICFNNTTNIYFYFMYVFYLLSQNIKLQSFEDIDDSPYLPIIASWDSSWAKEQALLLLWTKEKETKFEWL